MSASVVGLMSYYWFYAIRKINYLKTYRTHGIATEGVVIEHHVKTDSDNYDHYAPIVEFITAAGEKVMLFDDAFVHSRKKPALNSSVIVHYFTDDPKEGIVDVKGKIKR